MCPKVCQASKIYNCNKGIAWLYSEVCALLDVWADHDIQQQLAGRLHNMCVYEKISQRLLAMGIDRTAEQCREKIKKLKRDYKTVIDNNYSPAFARKLLGCFDKVHEVFGKCAVVKPSSVVESLAYNERMDANEAPPSSQALQNTEQECSATHKNEFSTYHELLNESNDANSSSSSSESESDNSTFANNDELQPTFYQDSTDNHIANILNFSKLQDEFFSRFASVEERRFRYELERERLRLKHAERRRQQEQQREFRLFRSLLTVIASQQARCLSHLNKKQ